jgi:hypothetical protein
MYAIVRIDGDPTTWTLQDPIDAGLLTGLGEPLAVQVTHPLRGTLLLSVGAAAGVALLDLPVNWIPGHIQLPEPALYLPSPAGPTDSDHGYTLPAAADLAKLQSDITAAMTDGTILPVALAGGVLVLNGATLPFAVLCTASVSAAAT